MSKWPNSQTQVFKIFFYSNSFTINHWLTYRAQSDTAKYDLITWGKHKRSCSLSLLNKKILSQFVYSSWISFGRYNLSCPRFIFMWYIPHLQGEAYPVMDTSSAYIFLIAPFTWPSTAVCTYTAAWMIQQKHQNSKTKHKNTKWKT